LKQSDLLELRILDGVIKRVTSNILLSMLATDFTQRFRSEDRWSGKQRKIWGCGSDRVTCAQ
jgi:hypothetical protein